MPSTRGERRDSTGFDVPIAFALFNRPDLTRQVLEQIAQVRPTQLYVIADGPRADVAGEAELCQRTRALIDDIDWPCEVTRDFSPVNLGCGRRISSGLDRAFVRHDRLIVLEDDCLPHPSFFPFCRDLLERYELVNEVMNITGVLDSDIRIPTDESYFFTSLPRIWGWASWRRAWRGYDFELEDWPREEPLFKQRLIDYYHGGEPLARRMRKVVERRIDTWDYQWWYHVFRNEGLCINPSRNLIENIGFDSRATHLAPRGGRALPIKQGRSGESPHLVTCG